MTTKKLDEISAMEIFVATVAAAAVYGFLKGHIEKRKKDVMDRRAGRMTR